MSSLNRRDFLKTLGIGTGASALSACGIDDNRYPTPIEQVLPYVVRPEQVTPGTPTFFATTTESGPTAWPVLARHREGRVVNLGANKRPGLPNAVPKSSYFELQRAYSPDRFASPLDGETAIEWDAALTKLTDAVKAARAGGKTVAYLGPYRSGSIVSLLGDYTQGNAVFWEPLGYGADAQAAEILFGSRALPAYRLDDAHYVLSFGAEFLGDWGGPRLQAGYAKARNPNHGHFVARFGAVTSHMDQTTSNADDWYQATPGSEALVALAVAKQVATDKGYTGPLASLVAAGDAAKAAAASGLSEDDIKAIAGHFAGATAAVALPGGTAGASAAAVDLAVAVFALNIVSGNGGKTFGTGGYAGPVDGYDRVEALIADMAAGNVGVLLIDDHCNPAFSLPAGAKFADALAKVGTVVGLSSHPNETTAFAGMVLPTSGVFEDWGDAEPGYGVHLLRQPAMTPLNDTRSLGDILLATARGAGLAAPVAAPVAEPPAAGEGDEAADAEAPVEDGAEAVEDAVEEEPAMVLAPLGFAPETWRDYVAARWQRYYNAADSGAEWQRWWETTLGNGGFVDDAGFASPDVSGSHTPGGAAELAGAGEYALVAYPHGHIGDGRWANQPWAQEASDPTSGQTWDSWVVMHHDAAAKIGVETGDLVEVTTETGTMKLGAQVYGDIKPDVLAIAFGNGHTGNGRYSKGTGQNVVGLLGATKGAHGTMAWQQAKASLRALGGKADLAPTFGSHSDQLRQLAPVANAGQLATMGDTPTDHDQHAGMLTGVHHLPRDQRLVRATPHPHDPEAEGSLEFYPIPDHPVYRWGLTVDVNACNGCGTCAIACAAENNIAVVGKKEVQKQREMSWIRMNRFRGFRNSENQDGRPREARFLPVMCQQCGHAPCESVCPVLATYHTLEGLNAMIYNRCAGTRYCANACPYKARKFNWHTYAWPEPFNLQLNPDVTARTMGIMEKCTFCVQRIKATASAYRDKSFTAPVPSADIEQLTACAEACPSDALTFGNIKEEASAVAKLRKSNRSYELLAELNVFSAVNYLAKASFHVGERSDHHGGGGDHADAAEGHGEAVGHEPAHDGKAEPAHGEAH